MPSRKKTARHSKRSASRSPSPTRHTKRRKSSRHSHSTKPKRPLSGYMYFVQQERSRVVKAHPSYKVTEIAKELGSMWRGMSASDKRPFEEMSNKDKARYAREKGKRSD